MRIIDCADEAMLPVVVPGWLAIIERDRRSCDIRATLMIRLYGHDEGGREEREKEDAEGLIRTRLIRSPSTTLNWD